MLHVAASAAGGSGAVNIETKEKRRTKTNQANNQNKTKQNKPKPNKQNETKKNETKDETKKLNWRQTNEQKDASHIQARTNEQIWNRNQK